MRINSRYIKQAGFLLGILLLGGCADTTVEPVEKETKVEEPTAVEEPKSVETTAPPVKVEAPPVKVEAPPKKDTKHIEAYGAEMSGYFGTLTTALSDFSILAMEAGEDPYMMFNDDWLMASAVVLTIMDDTIAKIKGVTPPAELQEVHRLTLQAMSHFQFVVDNYPDAIDNLDVELLTQCAEQMTLGSSFIQQANAKLEELNL